MLSLYFKSLYLMADAKNIVFIFVYVPVEEIEFPIKMFDFS